MTEENFDFDFSQYEGEEDSLNNIDKTERDKITLYRSRYSLSAKTHDILGDLKAVISKNSAEIESGSKDITLYRKVYGYLTELIAHCDFILGETIINSLNEKKDKCKIILTENTVTDKIRDDLLDYRLYAYKVISRLNLSFDVERVNNGLSAKNKITQ